MLDRCEQQGIYVMLLHVKETIALLRLVDDRLELEPVALDTGDR
jgi:hypothetical protein